MDTWPSLSPTHQVLCRASHFSRPLCENTQERGPRHRANGRVLTRRYTHLVLLRRRSAHSRTVSRRSSASVVGSWLGEGVKINRAARALCSPANALSAAGICADSIESGSGSEKFTLVQPRPPSYQAFANVSLRFQFPESERVHYGIDAVATDVPPRIKVNRKVVPEKAGNVSHLWFHAPATIAASSPAGEGLVGVRQFITHFLKTPTRPKAGPF
jgi:hypothetical protein